jgi:prepilin-type N-terminal cleavage/methylation domain-containing protein
MLDKEYKNTHIRGFTLIELLVVIAIISILTGAITVVAGNMLASAKSTREADSLRSVLQAYTMAATDRKGTLIDGYSNNEDETFAGPNGEPVPWPASGRYVWRLLPYLDNAMTSLYVNDQSQWLTQYSGTNNYAYVASLFPSFGLNSEWMGGDQRTTAMPAIESKRLYGKFLSDIRHPARQLVFASSKAPLGTDASSPELMTLTEGYFEIKSPYFPSAGDTWRWNTVNGEQSTVPTDDSADHGNLSARHSGKVLIGKLDGSTEFITLQNLADMRRWAPKANTANWTPTF